MLCICIGSFFVDAWNRCFRATRNRVNYPQQSRWLEFSATGRKGESTSVL